MRPEDILIYIVIVVPFLTLIGALIYYTFSFFFKKKEKIDTNLSTEIEEEYKVIILDLLDSFYLKDSELVGIENIEIGNRVQKRDKKYWLRMLTMTSGFITFLVIGYFILPYILAAILFIVGFIMSFYIIFIWIPKFLLGKVK